MAELRGGVDANKLEDILARLLTPDNSVIQQATAELKEVLKSPSSLGQLAALLTTSQFPQVRQYAAILLRRKIVKVWNNLDAGSHLRFKQLLIQGLMQEQIKIVQQSTAEIVSVIAKYELPEGRWPELMNFIGEYTRSSSVKDNEIGLHVLKSISSNGGNTLRPYFSSLFALFEVCLNSTDNVSITSYAVEIMTNIMDCLETSELNAIKPLIPKVIEILRKLVMMDESRARDGLEFFEQLVECNVAIINPYISDLIQFCFQVAHNDQFEDSTRSKCLSFVSWLATLRKKAILRLNLIPTTLEVVFPILASSISSDDADNDDVQDENSTVTIAGQLIDVFALHMPPEVFFVHLSPYIHNYFNSQEPLKMKAALVAIAVIAEGCREHIRNTCLDEMMVYIANGIENHHEVVQNAGLYALGQFAMHLQPDINKYAPKILPLLFNHLGVLVQKTTPNKTFAISRAYYALEQFCEHLDSDIVPYLQSLLEMLLTTLNSTQILYIKELAMSAIGATANAAKTAIRPYFQGIIEILKPYIVVPSTGEDFDLRLQAIDTLGCLIRHTDENMLGSFAEECVQLGLDLINKMDDPDIRRCVYALISSVSFPAPDVIRKYINAIAMRIIASIQSRDGLLISTSYDDGPLSNLVHFDDNDSDDDENDKYCEVSNAFLAEKEDACNSLSEIVKNIGTTFLPYLDESLLEVNKLVTSEWENIRKAAITCLATLCRLMYACNLQFNSGTTTAVNKTLEGFLHVIMQIVEGDSDRSVVIAALTAAEEVLRDLHEDFAQNFVNIAPRILRTLSLVLRKSVACQGDEDDTEAEEYDAGIAEYDGMVIEHAGGLLPVIISLIGGDAFASTFNEFLPQLAKRTKPTSSVSERSFAVGLLSEIIVSMGSAVRPFSKELYSIFMSSANDKDDEVCNNAIYGLGVLAEHSKEQLYGNYMAILQLLFRIGPKRGESSRRILDNICGCVCRLIITNASAVPIDNVFPQIIVNLPLKEDKEENKPVFTCILQLLNAKHVQVFNNMERLLVIFAEVLCDDEIDNETRTIIQRMVVAVHQQFPTEFDRMLKSMNKQQESAIMTVLNSPLS